MWNGAHFHLLVNHFPIILTIVLIPLIILQLFRRKDFGLFLSIVALMTIAGVGAGVSLITGEMAEEIVGPLPGIDEQSMDEHEEWAEVSARTLIITALITLVVFGLLVKKKLAVIPIYIGGGLLILTIISAAFMSITGHFGGKIHHQELRTDAKPTVILHSGGSADLDEDD